MVDATQSFALDRPAKLPVFNILGTTFQIFGKAPLVFMLFAGATQLPSALRLIISPPVDIKLTIGTGIVAVVNLLIVFFLQTSMIYIAFRLFDDQPTPIGEALRVGARRYLPMLGTTLLVMLAIYGAMLLLIVPGIIVACVYAVASPVCALEGTGPVTSMQRSGVLTKKTRWRILGVYLVFFIPLMVASGSITYLCTLGGHIVLGQWISLALQLFWVPLTTIFSTAIYVELRRLKEHAGVAQVFA